MTTGVPSAGDLLRAREGLLQLLVVVPVDRPDVVEAELVPDEVREEEPLDRVLDLLREAPRLLALREAS